MKTVYSKYDDCQDHPVSSEQVLVLAPVVRPVCKLTLSVSSEPTLNPKWRRQNDGSRSRELGRG